MKAHLIKEGTNVNIHHLLFTCWRRCLVRVKTLTYFAIFFFFVKQRSLRKASWNLIKPINNQSSLSSSCSVLGCMSVKVLWLSDHLCCCHGSRVWSNYFCIHFNAEPSELKNKNATAGNNNIITAGCIIRLYLCKRLFKLCLLNMCWFVLERDYVDGHSNIYFALAISCILGWSFCIGTRGPLFVKKYIYNTLFLHFRISFLLLLLYGVNESSVWCHVM